MILYLRLHVSILYTWSLPWLPYLEREFLLGGGFMRLFKLRRYNHGPCLKANSSGIFRSPLPFTHFVPFRLEVFCFSALCWLSPLHLSIDRAGSLIGCNVQILFKAHYHHVVSGFWACAKLHSLVPRPPPTFVTAQMGNEATNWKDIEIMWDLNHQYKTWYIKPDWISIYFCQRITAKNTFSQIKWILNFVSLQI